MPIAIASNPILLPSFLGAIPSFATTPQTQALAALMSMRVRIARCTYFLI